MSPATKVRPRPKGKARARPGGNRPGNGGGNAGPLGGVFSAQAGANRAAARLARDLSNEKRAEVRSRKWSRRARAVQLVVLGIGRGIGLAWRSGIAAGRLTGTAWSRTRQHVLAPVWRVADRRLFSPARSRVSAAFSHQRERFTLWRDDVAAFGFGAHARDCDHCDGRFPRWAWGDHQTTDHGAPSSGNTDTHPGAHPVAPPRRGRRGLESPGFEWARATTPAEAAGGWLRGLPRRVRDWRHRSAHRQWRVFCDCGRTFTAASYRGHLASCPANVKHSTASSPAASSPEPLVVVASRRADALGCDFGACRSTATVEVVDAAYDDDRRRYPTVACEVHAADFGGPTAPITDRIRNVRSRDDMTSPAQPSTMAGATTLTPTGGAETLQVHDLPPILRAAHEHAQAEAGVLAAAWERVVTAEGGGGSDVSAPLQDAVQAQLALAAMLRAAEQHAAELAELTPDFRRDGRGGGGADLVEGFRSSAQVAVGRGTVDVATHGPLQIHDVPPLLDGAERHVAGQVESLTAAYDRVRTAEGSDHIISTHLATAATFLDAVRQRLGQSRDAAARIASVAPDFRRRSA